MRVMHSRSLAVLLLLFPLLGVGCPTPHTPRLDAGEDVGSEPDVLVELDVPDDAGVPPEDTGELPMDAPIEPMLDAPIAPMTDAPIAPMADAPIAPMTDAPTPAACVDTPVTLGPTIDESQRMTATVWTGSSWLFFRFDAMDELFVHVVTGGTVGPAISIRRVTTAPIALTAVWTGTHAVVSYLVEAAPGGSIGLVTTVVDGAGSVLRAPTRQANLPANSRYIDSAYNGSDAVGVAISGPDAGSGSLTLHVLDLDGVVDFTPMPLPASTTARAISIAYAPTARMWGIVWVDRGSFELATAPLRGAFNTVATFDPSTDILGEPQLLGDAGSFYISTLRAAVPPGGTTVRVLHVRASDRTILTASSFTADAPNASTSVVNGDQTHDLALDPAGDFHLVYDRTPSLRPADVFHIELDSTGAPLGTGEIVSTGLVGTGTSAEEPTIGLAGAQMFVTWSQRTSIPSVSWSRRLTTVCYR